MAYPVLESVSSSHGKFLTPPPCLTICSIPCSKPPHPAPILPRASFAGLMAALAAPVQSFRRAESHSPGTMTIWPTTLQPSATKAP